LRTRWKRWSRTWCTADGLVEPDVRTRAALAPLRLTARSYSASSLQHFSACPYRFVLHAIHHLRPAERPVALEQMDPLTRGELFHQVQFRLLRLLERDELQAITDVHLPQILERADRIFDEVAAEFEERLAPAIPRVWKSEVDELRADLHGWLRSLAGQQGNWIPFRFEYAFGLPRDESRDPRSTEDEAVILDGFRLRGSIDLIEQQAGTGKLRITDHKTGKPPEQYPVSIGGGAALQPVLYSLAVEQLLSAHVEAGRLYYATRRGNFLAIELPLDTNARERARLALHTIDKAIEDGFLPAAPHQGACDYCDYRPVCGPHEELRTKSKPKRRLEALYELRAQP
jgi:ATP-dependent helicase/nuclease subunit B